MTITIKRIISVLSGSFLDVETEIKSGPESDTKMFRLLAEQYTKLRPQKGEITQYQYEELEEASEVCDAYSRAANILSFGMNTARTLKQKLRRRGFSESAADEAVRMLCEKGYISENDDIRRATEHCINKGWGMRRILAYLKQKGYGSEALSIASDEMSEVDFPEVCADLIEKKYGSVPTEVPEKQKMVAFLVRYGFSMSEIREAVSKIRERSE